MICSNCKENKTDNEFYKNKTWCKECHTNGIKNKRKERLARGVCSNCDKQRLENDNLFCEYHFVQNRQRKIFKRSDAELTKILLDRFKNHPYCYYTDEKLILGLNASLDHKQSVSNHPELAKDIDNLVWVSWRVNWTKRAFNEDEFINFCKRVVKNNPK